VCAFAASVKPAPRPAQADRPILFFDAECVICNRAARLLLRLDRNQTLHLASLQGSTARDLLAAEALEGVDSIVLLDEQGCHLRSEAALRAARCHGGRWSRVKLLRVLPRSFRDAANDPFASRRIGWFGRVEACGLLSPEQRARVLP
jgi:predicted DCC family thiol-disulfide oxidoreductase YuxK